MRVEAAASHEQRRRNSRVNDEDFGKPGLSFGASAVASSGIDIRDADHVSSDEKLLSQPEYYNAAHGCTSFVKKS
jgi:hypothetical protein